MSNTHASTFPIYQITADNIIATNNNELSIIGKTPVKSDPTPTHTHDDDYFNTNIQTRCTITSLVVCMVISFLLGCILMWSYIINNQQISVNTDGYYTSVIFGEEYSYR